MFPPLIKGTDHWRWRNDGVQRAPWQPVFEVPNNDCVVCFDAAFPITRLAGAHGMYVEDFSVSEGSNCFECVTHEENPTRTRQGGLRKKDEWFSRKCLQLVDRDVQSSFGRRSCHIDSRKWKAMGHFTSRWLSARSIKCGIGDREWWFTALIPSRRLWLCRPRLNVNGPQTTVHAKRCWRNSKLPTNLAPQLLASETGHTNERSLADYEEGDENEQRLISLIISLDSQASTSNQRGPFRMNVGLSYAVENTQMMNKERFMTINNFHGCQVTITYQLSQTFSEPRCNVP